MEEGKSDNGILTMEQKFSEGYRILCRFFKEVKLYHEFIEYQNAHDAKKIPINTKNPVKSLGNTSITNWFEVHKKLFIKSKIYEVFKLWLMELNPKLYDMYETPPVYNAEAKIDKRGRTIKLERKWLKLKWQENTCV